MTSAVTYLALRLKRLHYRHTAFRGEQTDQIESKKGARVFKALSVTASAGFRQSLMAVALSVAAFHTSAQTIVWSLPDQGYRLNDGSQLLGSFNISTPGGLGQARLDLVRPDGSRVEFRTPVSLTPSSGLLFTTLAPPANGQPALLIALTQTPPAEGGRVALAPTGGVFLGNCLSSQCAPAGMQVALSGNPLAPPTLFLEGAQLPLDLSIFEFGPADGRTVRLP